MKEVCLTDVCSIQYGYPFDSSLFSASDGLPLVRIRDVVRGYSETYTNEPCGDEYIVNDGDLLVGMDGEFNIARWKGGKALLNQRVCRLMAKAGMDETYLFYFMQKELKKVEDKTPFATVKHLSARQMNSIKVPLRPIEEQKKIAAVLDKIDWLMALRQRQIDRLEELVKSRFVEMFGDPVNNPMNWPKYRFEEISTLITDGEHVTPQKTEKGIYLLSARNVLNHRIQLDNIDFISEQEYERIARRVSPQKGDVLVSCSGSVGRCCAVPDKMRFQMVRSVALIRFDGTINPVFAEWLISSDELQRQISHSATQSSQANLFQGKIQKLCGYVPPKELQDIFADFVGKTEKPKATIQQSLEELKILKKSKMQQYF